AAPRLPRPWTGRARDGRGRLHQYRDHRARGRAQRGRSRGPARSGARLHGAGDRRRPRDHPHLGPQLLRAGGHRPAVGRRAGGARGPRTSRSHGSIRLDRPATVAEPGDRTEVAGGPVLPRSAPDRPARRHARVLPSLLPRRSERARARRADCLVQGPRTRWAAAATLTASSPGLVRTSHGAPPQIKHRACGRLDTEDGPRYDWAMPQDSTAHASAARARLGGSTLTVVGGLTLLLALLLLAATLVGAYPISLADLAAALGRRLTGAPPQGQVDTVLFDIRLPRMAAAVLVGAALATAGAAYQTLFRNPLVSPDILGVSTGAGLGAVLGIFLSLPVALIQLSAFAAGLATVGLVYAIASLVRGREPILVLVLAGIVVGALAGAAISLLKIMADPYDQLPAIVFWLLGSLSSVRKGEV